MQPETLRPELPPTDAFDLRGRRVHEAEGRGRRTFALFQAVRHPGPLVWILPAHVPAFIAAQLAGAVLAWAGMRWLHAESTAAAPEQVGAEQSQEAGP